MSKGGHNKRKDNTNDYKSIDISLFQRAGRLKAGNEGYYHTYWTNSRTRKQAGSMTTYTTTDYIRLIYTTTHNWTGEKKDHDYNVEIDWTPCNYGGQRAWFVCPECGEKARKLYMKNSLFYCRKCNNLNYYSQQISKTDQLMDGIREKIYRVQKRLKAERNPLSHWEPRPKGMHFVTYQRLLQELRELQEEYTKAFMFVASKLGITP